MNARPISGRDGFTLIELVIVILMLGILAGVAIPRYGEALAAAHVDAAARRIAADLRYARAEALRTSLPQTVDFSTADNAYVLASARDPDHPSQTYRVDLGGAPYKVDIAEVDFSGGALLTYDIHGVPSSDGHVRLSAGGHRIAVICDALGATQYASW